MIRLHPITDADHDCPYCKVHLEVKGWYIPGMRNLADLTCPQCARDYYGDLPSGHGLFFPMLLEKTTGTVHDRFKVLWFAEWLNKSYAQRENKPLNFTVEEIKPVQKAVLLNCLDTRYGHCLLKLLNAQYYLDNRPDLGLIVLVPRIFRWLVPEGAAAIWTVDLPLSCGIEWNDWLAREICHRIDALHECYLSLAFSHPHQDDFDIERFSQVKPFPMYEWEDRLKEPKITFIMREDRLWDTAPSSKFHRAIRRYMNRFRGKISHPPIESKNQLKKIVLLASKLKKQFPTLDFAVAGLGEPGGGLPDWILDLRVTKPDEATERALCERYAESHVVVGVHGSNMLLPSAHTGAVVELMPEKRWGNVLEDILFRKDDQRETVFRYRVLPITTSVDTLSDIITSILSNWSGMLLNMQRGWCKHESGLGACSWSDEHFVLRQHCRLHNEVLRP